MVKVLVYSSKEIYDNASYEGRAEADLIAYRNDDRYVITKNRIRYPFVFETISKQSFRSILDKIERDEWLRDKELLSETNA